MLCLFIHWINSSETHRKECPHFDVIFFLRAICSWIINSYWTSLSKYLDLSICGEQINNYYFICWSQRLTEANNWYTRLWESTINNFAKADCSLSFIVVIILLFLCTSVPFKVVLLMCICDLAFLIKRQKLTANERLANAF